MKESIYFFIGTEAELIKIFPVIIECQKEGCVCHIIASGQNDLKKSRILGFIKLNGKFIELSNEEDIQKSAIGLLKWFLAVKKKAPAMIKSFFTAEKLKGADLVVHGDTISTMMGAFIGKKLGMRICHVEAGLRSHNLLNPFPEEIDRLITSKMARMHFAPGRDPVNNLKGVKGRVINTHQNTLLDSLIYSEKIPLENDAVTQILGEDYFVFVMHRQENLVSKTFVQGVVNEIIAISKKHKCVIVLHEITKNAFYKFKLIDALRENNNIILLPRMDYFDFMKLLRNAKFVITDGGSNQEELFYMNKPCLLMRKTTERNEGIGANARLFNGEVSDIRKFVHEVEVNTIGGGYKNEEQSISYNNESANKRVDKLNKKIVILMLSWRAIKSPNAGGAEVHAHEMLSRADKNKYKIYYFTTRSQGQAMREEIDGVTYIRHGNVFTVILAAHCFYKKYKDRIDFVIDQCNTHRFFTPFWVEPRKRIFYIHQLTKEVWDYNVKFPFNKIGKVFEEIFLRLNCHDPVITVSESTRDELVERGYDKKKIKIIYNGVSFVPWKPVNWLKKESNPTFIYAGRYSPYKGIDIAVNALVKIKKEYPNARLWIIGKKDQKYVNEKLMPICKENNLIWEDAIGENCKGDIVSWGYVSEKKKLELLSRSWALLFPSIREGWGIPITEAGCVGTPCVAFNSPGIREAVKYGKAGYLCTENTSEGLAKQMRIVVVDRDIYSDIQQKAYMYSSQFQWEDIGKEFGEFIETILAGL